jgi:hypothetical protein
MSRLIFKFYLYCFPCRLSCDRRWPDFSLLSEVSPALVTRPGEAEPAPVDGGVSTEPQAQLTPEHRVIYISSLEPRAQAIPEQEAIYTFALHKESLMWNTEPSTAIDIIYVGRLCTGRC